MKLTLNNASKTIRALTFVFYLGLALPLFTIVSGCAGDRYHRSTGESVDDASTSARVKSALARDAEYKYNGVDVKTFKGTVQLSGFVDTRDQKSRAASVAKNVEGVKEVKNSITVKD